MKIRINNKTFFYFNNFAVQLNLDSVASSFSFIARFNPDNKDHKILFKPLSYPKIEVFKNDDTLLLTGVIVDHVFNSDQNPHLVKLSGYSLGGVLEDSTIPYAAYPLESINRSLKDISRRLLKLFNLSLIIDINVLIDANLIYPKSVASPAESVQSYLSKLTSQRNIVMSHDIKGDIVYFRLNTISTPKIFFNTQNTVKMRFSITGQGLHDEITVIRQPSKENNNLSPVDTIKNPLINAFRPRVKTLSSGTDTDTAKAADNALASELKHLRLTIMIPRWEDLWPGDLVEVQNEEIYIYKRTKFIIKSITLGENEKSNTMSLSVVLPEAYTGKQPKNIFA